MAIVSVIIPCFNQGNFLHKAIDSVLQQTFTDFEIIVVNDGSTDPNTRKTVQNLNYPKTRVIHTTNQGLAAARNNGIKEAIGKYILPLDADDFIEPNYLNLAVPLLRDDPNLGIVYCRAMLFGSVETEWLLPTFTLEEMLKDNLIFCTALFRKSDWEQVGGYDPGMIYGWEDYDFWLSLIESGYRVHQIPEILFHYRVSSGSMVRSTERKQKIQMFKRIFNRHNGLFQENIEVWIDTVLKSRERYYTSRLYIDTGTGISDSSSISRNVEKNTSTITFELQDSETVQALRFDPVDCPVVIEVVDIIFTYNNKKTKTITSLSDNALFHCGPDRYFETNDPQFFFDVEPNDLENLLLVTVNLSFKALEIDAQTAIINHLKKYYSNNQSQEKSPIHKKIVNHLTTKKVHNTK